MAVELNPLLLEWSQSMANWRFLALGKQATVRGWKRGILRKIEANIHGSQTVNSLTLNIPANSRFEQRALDRGLWHYLESPFTADSLQSIKSNWPSINCFTPSRDYTKTYDRFGMYDYKNGIRKQLGLSSELASELVSCLKDARWIDYLKLLRAQTYDLQLANMGLAWSRSGSYLLPHKDSVGKLGDGSWLNVIFIINSFGSDQTRVGRTSFYFDNTYSKLAFAPDRASNCAIIYDTTSDIYHGFPPLGRQSWSWRIVAQYAAKAELENDVGVV